MLSSGDWAGWAKKRTEAWTQALADAVDDVRRAVSGQVEADPAEAQRRAQAMYDALFAGPDAPVPGIWARVGWLWGMERELGPEGSKALYEGLAETMRRAGQENIRAEDLTGDAVAKRAHELTIAFLKDAEYRPSTSGAPGFAPLVVGGILVVGFLGACWAWVRSEQAKVELARTDNVRAGLDFYTKETAAGRTPSVEALAAIMAGNAPPKDAPTIDASGSGSSWMMAGALGLAALVGVGLMFRRGG